MNAQENFLSMNKDELLEWIKFSYEIDISADYGKKTSKAMLEQEILYWVDENNQSVEVENEIFDFLESL